LVSTEEDIRKTVKGEGRKVPPESDPKGALRSLHTCFIEV